MRFRTRRLLQASALGAVLAVVTCCVPAPPAPTPAPRPTPTPAPVPPPAPAATPIPTFSDWRDVPQTLGDWSYRATADGSLATYGAAPSDPIFSLSCRRVTRTIALARMGSAPGATQMIVRTTNRDSATNAAAATGGLPAVTASLSARDPLLDAMAFSRGRFAVEVPGLPTVYLPAWPEVMRVIEDCR